MDAVCNSFGRRPEFNSGCLSSVHRAVGADAGGNGPKGPANAWDGAFGDGGIAGLHWSRKAGMGASAA
jgi:hypothetical protein